MPSTTSKTHKCLARSSTLPQSTSLGRKRKHQVLSDVFDDNDTAERHTDDKGKKLFKKLKKNEVQRDVVDHCQFTRVLVATSTQTEPLKSLQSASRVQIGKLQLHSDIFDEHDTQDKKAGKKMDTTKATKGRAFQPSNEPLHGILRNVAQIDSSEHPQSTCPAKPLKHRLLPDLFHGDLDKHAAQDKLVLEGLKRQEVPLDVVGHVPKYMLWPIILEVTSVIRMEDPHVPLIRSSVDISNAIHDEGFQKIGRDCYRSKSFKDIRNYSLIRTPKVRFLDDC